MSERPKVMDIDTGGIFLRVGALILVALYLWITLRALFIEIRRTDRPVWQRALWAFLLLTVQVAGPAAWYLNELVESRSRRHRGGPGPAAT
ncbi:hypothetical protein ACSJJR_09780 [Actinomyces sp. W5033]